jgi:hypothetical protein
MIKRPAITVVGSICEGENPLIHPPELRLPRG